MKWILLIVFLIPGITGSTQSVRDGRQGNPDYLNFARQSADWTYEHQDSLLDLWKQSFDPLSIFGYRPPSRLLETATIYASLFEIKGKKIYAERAKEILLAYDDHKKIYPQWAVDQRPDYTEGVPALPDFFTAQRFLRPFGILKEHGLFSPPELARLEQVIAHSVAYLLQSQEWGAMNRAALRAETMAWAVRVLPDHPDAAVWRMYQQALIHDNWGAWQIEDATHYNAIWLYALIGYGYASEQLSELFAEPEMYYYSAYYKELFCPDGSMPDWGDSYWQSNWSRWLVYFETCATVYGSAEHKWIAETIAAQFIDWEAEQAIGLAYILLDCFLLGDERIKAEQPRSTSREVLEDVQGKKIVFRSGWDPDDSYCLLNYKDEGEAGYLSRQFLRDGIVTEEEKMTHGHADENSIVLLMDDGQVLLHDGGYRDYMPSGPFGAYRQDYFHNRLCVRGEKIFYGQAEGEYRYDVPGQEAVAGQNVLDFMRNSGAYRMVQTQKIDFLTFDDFDYSRTRVIDEDMGYESDRVFVWVKEKNCYVVFDILKSLRPGFLTAASLWHTRQIHARGERWFDTSYDSLRQIALDQSKRLLVYFPEHQFSMCSSTPEKRYWQREFALAQYAGQHFETNQILCLVSILYPHDASVDPESLIQDFRLVETDDFQNGLAVQIRNGQDLITVGAKLDLRKEMIRDYRRPKYTYESGQVSYGDLESNCDFFCICEQDDDLKFTVINVSKAVYKGSTLFEQKPNYFGLAFDGKGNVSGVSKARYWRVD